MSIEVMIWKNLRQTLSYADCFAVATAMKENASIVTGDPEFKKKVQKIVKIEWI